jgi:4'-phosphopantetheinyl transferase
MRGLMPDEPSNELLWSIPSTSPTLEEGTVHIWRLNLDLTVEQLHRMWQLLSAEESERAERFRFQRDRIRFIAAHGALRLILGTYVGVDSRCLKFGTGEFGKPFIASPPGCRVTFNLTHSGRAALIAVALDRAVGVDLELVRSIPMAQSIVERMFSADDRRRYHAAPVREREHYFFRLWTQRESYLKATGQGLSDAERRTTEPDTAWQWQYLAPYPGYVGAVVVSGSNSNFRYFDWTPPTAAL